MVRALTHAFTYIRKHTHTYEHHTHSHTRTLNRMVPMTAKMDRTSTLMNRIFHIDLIDDSSPVTTTCRVQEQTYSMDTAVFAASVTHVDAA